MAQRHYTPDEVDRLIPQIEPIMRQLQKLKAEIDAKAQRLRVLRAAVRGGDRSESDDPLLQPEAELEFLYHEANALARRVAELGGQIKGIEEGLVDFPGRVGGEDVLLCWRLGEPRVAFYHNFADGFRGRKPLPGREPPR